MPQEKGRDQRLDWVRACALVLVVIYHSGALNVPGWSRVAAGGFVANTIFVGLAGFLVGLNPPVSITRWGFRRLARVMVPFWVVLVVLVLISLFSSVYERPSVAEGIAYISGLHYFFGLSLLGPHLWFVTFILLAYASVPLFLKIRGSNTLAISIVLLLAAALVAVLLLVDGPGNSYGHVSSVVSARLLYHLLVFWVSMLVGEKLGGNALERRVPPWLIALGILSFPVYITTSRSRSAVLSLVAVAAAFVASVAVLRFLVFLGSRFILRSHKLAALSSSVAQHSYEMYLIHYCLISVMVTLGIGWPGIVLLLPLSFVAAILVRGIARPLSDLITSFVFRPSEGRERRA